jgi:adenylate cyclase
MATSPTPEVRKGLPIVAYLVFGVSALVILSVGGVLLVTLSIATRNTVELLEDKSRLLISSVVHEVQLFLAPAHAQVEALARLIESGRLDPGDPEQLFGALQAGLAASPHVRSVVFLDPSGWLMAAIRSGRVPLPEVADWRQNPAGREAVAGALARPKPEAYWGAPVYLKDPGVTVVNLRRIVVVDGVVKGILASTITVKALSKFITGLESELGQNAFVLYERDFVLAHSTLALDFPDLSVERPLPRITEIGDPVLFEIWDEDWQKRRLRIGGSGHWHRLGNAEYLYLYRNLEPPADPRWLVGSYFAAEAVNIQLDRLLVALGVGLLALVAAAVAAVLLGRRVSRPIGQLAAAATATTCSRCGARACARSTRLRSPSMPWCAPCACSPPTCPSSSCRA